MRSVKVIVPVGVKSQVPAAKVTVSSILRSSIPGASLTNCVVVSGAACPPPPPPPRYCLNPVSSLMVPAPPCCLRSLASNGLMCASSVSPSIPLPVPLQPQQAGQLA